MAKMKMPKAGSSPLSRAAYKRGGAVKGHGKGTTINIVMPTGGAPAAAVPVRPPMAPPPVVPVGPPPGLAAGPALPPGGPMAKPGMRRGGRAGYAMGGAPQGWQGGPPPQMPQGGMPQLPAGAVQQAMANAPRMQVPVQMPQGLAAPGQNMPMPQQAMPQQQMQPQGQQLLMPGYKRGGRIAVPVEDVKAGAGSGIGRLQKARGKK